MLSLAATRFSGASLSAWANASVEGMMATAVGWVAAWVAFSLFLVVAWILLVSICHRLLAWRNPAAANEVAAAAARSDRESDFEQPPHDEFSKQLAGLGTTVRGQTEATTKDPRRSQPAEKQTALMGCLRSHQ